MCLDRQHFQAGNQEVLVWWQVPLDVCIFFVCVCRIVCLTTETKKKKADDTLTIGGGGRPPGRKIMFSSPTPLPPKIDPFPLTPAQKKLGLSNLP
jgi:hypothetical protein